MLSHSQRWLTDPSSAVEEYSCLRPDNDIMHRQHSPLRETLPYVSECSVTCSTSKWHEHALDLDN